MIDPTSAADDLPQLTDPLVVVAFEDEAIDHVPDRPGVIALETVETPETVH